MSETKRILQIVTQMNRAGLENRLMDIYRNIDRTRIQFDFYTCRKDEGFFDKEIKSLGGKVFYGRSMSLKHLLGIPRQFESFLRKHAEYRIVHCHLNQWCGLILLGAKHAGVPVRIAHSRAAPDRFSIMNLARNIIKVPVNRVATHHLAVSRKAGIWLFGRSMAKLGKIHVMANAIDLEKFRYDIVMRHSIRAKLNLQDAFVVLHVGNILPEKNHRFLIKVFAEVKKIHTNSKLVLIGKDTMQGKLQSLVAELGLSDDVYFLGARSEVPELLQAGDVFVFPSLYEGFPGAVLEAQASGLPCIISNTITNEVCLLPTTKQLSLSLPPRKWAEEVIATRNVERKDTYDVLAAAGYDVVSLARNLTKFYGDL